MSTSSKPARSALWLKSIAALGLALVLATNPANADALATARAGFAAKERRQHVLAVRLFDEALREGGFDRDQQGFVIYSRGVSYEALGVRDKALADFDAAIALLPNFPNSYIYRGLIWADKQEYDRAIDDFLRAGRLSPKDPMVFNNLAGVYEKKGDIDRAIQNYDNALRLKPDYAEAYYNRAHAFVLKQEVERAIADYEQAIWLQPLFADAFANRGVLYLGRGETQKALADFGNAIRIRPDDVVFWSNRANAFLTMANYADALSDFEKALQIDPGNPATYLGRGRARLFSGNLAGSIEDFATAVRLRPSNPYPVIWLHIARVHRGDADNEELAENAAKVKRDLWPTALLDYYLGRASAEQIRVAAQEGPDPESVKRRCEADYFLGEFDFHNGRIAEARALLEGVKTRCRLHDVVYGAAVAELALLPR